ncbi:MAG: adenosylcobinamide-phosphate synthase CbiB [Desulfuromonadaceae bacterium]|nr:adenosylcobinamide-phosphate synthase CbiB [Desulfuromonadaceae bacterium]
MMPLWIQLLIALVLDALCGDPPRWPHPVQAIGRAALALEALLRRRLPDESRKESRAGLIATIFIVTATALITAGLVYAAAAMHPRLGDLISIVLLYTTLATRSLTDHARAVQQPLQRGDLITARAQLARLVGRDTDHLDESAISRAAVESVAENSVDGVTAPLLFALLGGPVGAMTYKAINTLDSTFGYKTERYLHFGRAAARLDDAATFIPARLTALLTFPAALLAGFDAHHSWRIFRRDRHNHPSPNGGQIEAAVAGALHIRLGGENRYFGEPTFRPYMGDVDDNPITAHHIGAALRLMWLTTTLMALLGLVGRWAFLSFFSGSLTL